MKPDIIRVGLTGGIACGKSTASAILTSLGVPVLDADKVARDVVQAGSAGLQEIVEYFGPTILLPDGTLHREALRQIIIQDPVAKQTLEAITHPKIFNAMNDWQQIQAANGVPVTIVDAALMVETGSYQLYDGLIVISCQPETQLTRLMQRNQIDQEVARQWIASQLPLIEKELLADWVIYNDSSIEALKHQIHSTWPEFVENLRQKARDHD